MEELYGEKWFEHHMEEFVKPRLGKIPPIDMTIYYLSCFTPKYLKAMKGMWTEVKRLAHGRRVLLPGRDVFLFEILARQDGYPTMFRPDLSTNVSAHLPASEREQFKDLFCVDTGYKGTVPKNLGCTDWKLMKYNPIPPKDLKQYKMDPAGKRYLLDAKTGTYIVNPEYAKWELENKLKYQIFPRQRNNAAINGLSSLFEGCPKYWKSAEWALNDKNDRSKGGKVKQYFAEASIFSSAASLTQHIWGREYTKRFFYGAIIKPYFDWLPAHFREKFNGQFTDIRVGGRTGVQATVSDPGSTQTPQPDLCYVSSSSADFVFTSLPTASAGS